MSDKTVAESASHWCVLLPCSKDETWAVPQKCLAEIVTLAADTAEPPDQLTWRGQEVPIVDLGAAGSTPWRDSAESTGLVAVMLGLKKGGWEYCGIALRGQGLGMKDLAREAVEDAPDSVREGAISAFRIGEQVYQIPALEELYKRKERQLSAA